MRIQGMQGYPDNLWRRDLLLALVLGCALLNGTIYSPAYDSVSYFLYNFARGSVFFSPPLLDNVVSGLISVLTLMLSGIPAAVYERIRGLPKSTPVSLGIWLVTALLLTLPTVRAMFGDDY